MVWSLTQHCLIKFVWYSPVRDYSRPEWQANVNIMWAQTNYPGSKLTRFLKANWLLILEYAGLILTFLFYQFVLPPFQFCHTFNIYIFLKNVTFWYLICIFISHIKNNTYTEYISKKSGVIVLCFQPDWLLSYKI